MTLFNLEKRTDSNVFITQCQMLARQKQRTFHHRWWDLLAGCESNTQRKSRHDFLFVRPRPLGSQSGTL